STSADLAIRNPLGAAPCEASGVHRRKALPLERVCLDSLCQVIIQVVPAQFLLEIFQIGVFIDQEKLDSGDLGEVTQMLGRDGVAESRVMRAARIDPCRSGDLEAGARLPERSRDR